MRYYANSKQQDKMTGKSYAAGQMSGRRIRCRYILGIDEEEFQVRLLIYRHIDKTHLEELQQD